MATYNGELFLEEQLESIVWQTYQDWTLFIRDDDSTDCTKTILQRYASLYPNKIFLVEDDLQAHCPQKNFQYALDCARRMDGGFDYYMFADQDDVWFPDKVEKTLSAIKEVESKYDGPVLAHTDLCVVDASLELLAPSFLQYRSIDGKEDRLCKLLVQNNVTGCTTMWNRKLDDIIADNLGESVMHDWWLSLAAACFGKRLLIEEPTMLYRQHESNSIGATNVHSIGFIVSRLIGHNRVKEVLELSFKQAEDFYQRYRDILSNDQAEVIRNMSSIAHMSPIEKRVALVRGGYLKQGPVQIIGELMLV